MLDNKLLAIILVNYNGAQDTIDCINSIRQSQGIKYKVIIVDNASKQQNYELLKQHYSNATDVILYQNKKNSGFSAANNIGTSIAKEIGATHVLYLNNDTVVSPDAFLELFACDNEATVLTGKILYYFDKNLIWYAGGNYLPWKGTTVHEGVNLDYHLFNENRYVSFATGCYVFIPVKVLNKIGEWQEEYFLYSEDVAYSLKMAAMGVKIKYCPKSVIYHKVSQSTDKNSDLSNYYIIRNRFLVIRQYLCGIQKFSAYLYSLLYCVKGITKKNFSRNIVFKALGDFLKKKYGKSNDV